MIDLKKAAETIDRRWNADKALRESWERFRVLFSSGFWKQTMAAHLSKVDAAKLFATVSQLAPLMTDSRPIWTVTAREPSLQPVAELWNKALGYLWDHLDMGEKITASYQDALLMETGVLMVGWDPDDEEVSVDVGDPRNLVFPDGGYNDLDECPWVCQRRQYTVADVRRTYPDTSEDIVPDAVQREEDRLGYESDQFESHNDWVTVYELWMKDDTVDDELNDETEEPPKKKKMKYPNGRILVFTSSGRKSEPVELDSYPSPYEHGKSPYVLVYDYRLAHSVWGIGEGRHLLPLLEELNEVLQSISGKIRNACRPNYVLDPRFLDESDVKANLHRGYQIFVKKSQEEGDARYTGIELVPMSPPLQQEYQYVTLLEGLIEDVTSVTEILKGQAAKRERQTAQEYSGLYEAGHTRTRLRVRNMEKSIERTLTRILDVSMQFYEEERPISQRDDDGALSFDYVGNGRAVAERAVMRQVDAEFDRQEREETSEPFMGETDRDAAKDRALTELIASLPVGEDRVLAKFKVTVQPQSTLPTDQQSRANLATRLVQLGVIDDVDALKHLNWPDRESVIERKKQNAEAAAMAQAGGMEGVENVESYGPAGPQRVEPPALPAEPATG